MAGEHGTTPVVLDEKDRDEEAEVAGKMVTRSPYEAPKETRRTLATRNPFSPERVPTRSASDEELARV